MTTLRLNNISKQFGAVTVIPGLSLDIADGEFVALVGPSGCGKSTLLRMIAGLEPVSGGDLFIGDVRTNDVPPQKRNIAMVFQSYALFPHMTARENIAFGPMVRNEAAADTAARIEKAASILNLHAYLDRYPRQLSGGQRQRVAMGRAIVRDPQVFLFDEPLSNLDAQLRLQMRTEIKALHQRIGSTTVYVTHDQIEAMTMADRIVVMNGGVIEQVGAPLTLYDAPATRFVAGFIGSPPMNFMDGTLGTAAGGSRTVKLSDGSVIAVTTRQPSPDGTPVTLGIRPEHLARSSNEGGLALTVDVVEPTGSETVLYGTAAGVALRAVFHERLTVRPGDVVRLTAAPRDTHVFDAASGLRL